MDMNLPDGWHTIDGADQWTEILADSAHRPQLILKHSTRCGISHQVLHDLMDDHDGSIDVHVLDLLRHRDLSERIAADTGVWHQSPQMILLRDGEAVWSASHAAARFHRVPR